MTLQINALTVDRKRLGLLVRALLMVPVTGNALNVLNAGCDRLEMLSAMGFERLER